MSSEQRLLVGELWAGNLTGLELDGVVGKVRRGSRKLLDGEAGMEERWVGRDSSPEVVCGQSFKLKIRATEGELGDETE